MHVLECDSTVAACKMCARVVLHNTGYGFGTVWWLQTNGETPLHVASRGGHVEVVALVAASAVVNQADVSQDVCVWCG
jgi:hypothetical protein